MPYSDTRFDPLLVAFVIAMRATKGRPLSVIDIGAGAGKTSKLIQNHVCVLDAIEAHAPYVKQFGLQAKYTEVHVCDVRTFERLTKYDLAVMGDVMEHLSVVDAQILLKKLKWVRCIAYVQVPFLYEQGAVDGVESERHLQPDLTQAVMTVRYPTLQLIHADDRLGCYYQMP